MKTSKDLLKQANIVPKLRLGERRNGRVVSTGPHRIKILKDKLDKGTDHNSGQEVEVVKFLVEENGEHKAFERKKLNKVGELDYLIQRLAEIPEGSEIVLEMKKQGIKNYIEVMVVGESESVEEEDDDIVPEGEELFKKDGEIEEEDIIK